ncbi:MAG: ArnT family glycosyltransferase [Pyrinomonadaceae bacterium]
MAEEAAKRRWPFVLADIAAGLALFCGTAAVVWLQNSRLTVLYDVSGILENAMRMAEGQVPYLDFPFPYAPLTFLIQAELIRLTGNIYWHHIAYACIVGGLATVVTWRILLLIFEAGVPWRRLMAFLLSLPLVVLGIYCIFPHPFYDPDAAFVLLLCIFFALWLEKRRWPSIPTFLLGVLMVVPLFIKQNIGLAFLASTGIWLVGSIVINLIKRRSVRPSLLILAGIVLGLGAAYMIIQRTVGFDAYWYWTITFAQSRRAPAITDMLQMYQDWMVAFWVVIFLLGAFLLLRTKSGRVWKSIIWLILMAAPFAWPVIYLATDFDASERAERLMGFWPFIFVASVALTYVIVRRLKGVAAALPFVIVCSANGVFMSQQLWGSTYGIWPLLIILIAIVLRQLNDPEEPSRTKVLVTFAVLISASLIVAGSFYVYSNERLDYVELEDGELQHSKLPQLSGMAMRGDFLPDFEELVNYTNDNIPRDDGILMMPGEDLFYYTTGRVPQFPILTFDYSYNPYDRFQIRDMVLERNIEWVIVKNDTQLEVDQTIDDRKAMIEELKPYFRHVDGLNNYEIYKRRHPGDTDEDDDDSDDSGDDSPDDSSN